MPTPPVFNSAPQWLQVPPGGFPIIQPVYTGVAGPYTLDNTNLFWIYNEQEDNSGTNFNIVAYKSTNGGTAQPATRIASGIRIASGQGSPIGVSYPGSGNFIYICYFSHTGSDDFTGTLSVVTFDMSAGTFGTPLASSVTITGSDGCSQCIAYKLGNGNVIIGYDYGPNTDVNWTTNVTVYNGSSWSSPTTVGTIPNAQPFYAFMPISGNNTGFWWNDNPGHATTTMFYAVIDGNGNVVSSNTANNTLFNVDLGFPLGYWYDSNSDTSAVVVFDEQDELIKIIVATPSASPVFTTYLLYDNTALDTDYVGMSLVGNPAGNLFYFFTWDQTSNIVQVWVSSTLAAASWSGPTTFYSQTAHPPSPAPNGPETFPGYSKYLPNGTFVYTAGFIANLPATVCGVMADMVIASAPPPTQIIPEFPANPYPPPPYCIINKLVMYEVITNGSDTSAVLQTNLDVSAQNLSYGFPTVTFEMLDAAAYSATPYVISKSANTVTIGFSAVAASFRVVIDETNTLLR